MIDWYNYSKEVIKLNLPNKLTFLRILLIPVMIIVAYVPYLRDNTIFLNISLANFVNVAIFGLAALTDLLDGVIARKYNMITTFGKFADPLADKLIVMATMIILLVQDVVPLWAVILILSREFIVTGIRLVAVESGNVIAASKLGKIKTAVTMIALVVLFFWQSHTVVYYTGQVLIYLAVIFTVVSGIDYFYKNRKIILETV